MPDKKAINRQPPRRTIKPQDRAVISDIERVHRGHIITGLHEA